MGSIDKKNITFIVGFSLDAIGDIMKLEKHKSQLKEQKVIRNLSDMKQYENKMADDSLG